MPFEFDYVPSRVGTGNLKHDFARAFGKPAGVLPMWVADMDFAAPACVTEALRQRAESGVFGYADAKDGYYSAVTGWFRRRFGWETKREWIVKTPGVVYALATAIRAFTAPGDAVLIQPPVYHPFFTVVEENGRRLVQNPLRLENGRYSLDFADFEAKIVAENVKLFLLCSPHNPTGRVWTEAELKQIGEICLAHGVLVLSDEIHCDLTRPGVRHVPFLLASPESAGSAVVCTAPSKTFNLAGLQTSNIFLPDPALRERFQAEMRREGVGGPNALGLLACETAYREAEPWLTELCYYLNGNLAFIRHFLSHELPEVKLIEPQGTYFVWLDFRELGLTEEKLDDLILNRAGLWLDEGHIFGKEGSGFQRLVYATPRRTLEEALRRLKAAVRGK
ncbi:MAG: MalY/PatB family protein [bacterium]